MNFNDTVAVTATRETCFGNGNSWTLDCHRGGNKEFCVLRCPWKLSSAMPVEIEQVTSLFRVKDKNSA